MPDDIILSVSLPLSLRVNVPQLRGFRSSIFDSLAVPDITSSVDGERLSDSVVGFCRKDLPFTDKRVAAIRVVSEEFLTNSNNNCAPLDSSETGKFPLYALPPPAPPAPVVPPCISMSNVEDNDGPSQWHFIHLLSHSVWWVDMANIIPIFNAIITTTISK
ncbi:hypothetical protein FF38_00671 [Lucilia cuprina]|uniref:Uncharacterized protein n=1 Tax=Lucilia cuprina TaxID=7375 RepID=A0A0L0BPX5_LUCCU|nr:hypothetical protein FF38_00671 [Lucilia cuprina]